MEMKQIYLVLSCGKLRVLFFFADAGILSVFF